MTAAEATTQNKPAAQPLMSQEEYKANDGTYCPYCHSAQIQGGPVDVKNGCATRQPISCLDCGQAWVDVYQLHHFEPAP